MDTIVSVPSTADWTSARRDFLERTLRASYSDVRISYTATEVKVSVAGPADLEYLTERLGKIERLARKITSDTSLAEFSGSGRYREDPIPHLVRRGDVKIVSDGLFQFQGLFLKVFKHLNASLLAAAQADFGAVEQENPILWPVDLYKKINYLGDFPQQALILFGARRAEASLRSISQRFSSDNEFTCVPISDDFAPASFGVQSAVCDTCYYALQGVRDQVNVAYTTYNKVFRNETSAVNSLDRLPVFSVRDIIFIGSELYVLEMRNKAIDFVSRWLRLSGLNAEIVVADDPFFVGNVEKKLMQTAFALKYELVADIPFLSKRIALGSVNYHLDAFARSFDIKSGATHVHSACVGFGFERICLALYSQFGPNEEEWPHEVQQFCGILPSKSRLK
jgi:hypothetical protein